MIIRKKAFTLIELLIVVTIVASLAIMLIPYVTKSVEESRLARVASDITLIKNYISDYYKNQMQIVPDTGIMSTFEKSVMLLEYSPFSSLNHAPSPETTILSYLSDSRNIFIPKDPWGTPYSLNVLSDTLPDPLTIDFSTNPTSLKLVKFSSLSREKFASYDFGKFENLTIVNSGDLTIDMKYRLYYTDDFVPDAADSTFRVRDLIVSAESSIMDYGADIAEKKINTIALENGGLSVNDLGVPDRDIYQSNIRTLFTRNISAFPDIERFNLYLSLLFAENSTRNVRLDITSLKIELRAASRKKNASGVIQPSTQKYFYFCPFTGDVEFTVYSAGPDRSFNTTKDNIMRTEKLKIVP